MTVPKYTQVRIKRQLKSVSGKMTALTGAMMKVHSSGKGWYKLVVGPPGFSTFFRARRRDFAIMRQKIYCDLMEVVFP